MHRPIAFEWSNVTAIHGLNAVGSRKVQSSESIAISSCIALIRREGQKLHVEEHYYNPNALGMDDLYVVECLRLIGTAEELALAPAAQHPGRSRI